MYKIIVSALLLFLLATPVNAEGLAPGVSVTPGVLTPTVSITYNQTGGSFVFARIFIRRTNSGTSCRYTDGAETQNILWSQLVWYEGCPDEVTAGHLLDGVSYSYSASTFNNVEGWSDSAVGSFTPQVVAYTMDSGIQSSASSLLGSLVSQLFSVIVIGVGIVGGVMVTLFGLRWLIRFVRGNLHG